MGELNSNIHYIYYCGQESLKRNGVALILNKESKMQFSSVISHVHFFVAPWTSACQTSLSITKT